MPAQPTATASATSTSRWSVLMAFMLLGAVTQLVWLTYAPVTTAAAARMGVSENAVGWLANLFPLAYVLLAVPAGVLLDRGFRPAVVAGALLTAVGAVLRLAGDAYGWALAGQALAAVAQPLVLTAITGVAGRYLREEDRPLGIALGTSSTFAGMVVAFVLGAVLGDAAQLRTLVGVGAAVAVVAAVAVAVTFRRPAPHEPPAVTRTPLREVLRDRFVQRVALLVLLPFGVFIGLTTFGQALLDPAGVSAETSSVLLLLAVVAGVVGCAVVPVVAARRGRQRSVLVVALVVSAVACALLAARPGVVTGAVALVVLGLALLPALPVVLELVAGRTGSQESTAAGLVWMSGNLGGLLVSVVVGLLVDRPAVAFVLCGLLCLAAVPGVRGLGSGTPVRP